MLQIALTINYIEFIKPLNLINFMQLFSNLVFETPNFTNIIIPFKKKIIGKK